MNTNWTDEDLQRLIKALRSGATYDKIAQLLGRSRCSISGRVFRDKLGPERPRHPAPPPPQPPVHKLLKTAPKKPPEKPDNAPPAEPPPRGEPYLPTPLPAQESRNVALVELGPLQCKWPVHEAPDLVGGHAFCAAPMALGESYCAFHQQASAPQARTAAP